MNIEEIQKRIVEFRDKRDWKQFHNPKDLSISLVLEATELLEHFQWKNEEEIKKHLESGKFEEVQEEVADVLYWILLISHDLNIDIEKAFNKKMQQNESKYPVDKAKGSHKKYTEL